MIGAEHALPVGQQRLEQSQRLARVAALAGPESDVVAGRERVRVIGAEHALLVGQQRLEQSQRLARVAALAGPGSDVVAGRERVRVIGAEHALPVGQQRLEQSQRLAGVAALAGPGSDVVAGRERVRVIGAEHAHLVGQQRLEQSQRLARVAALAGPGSDVAAGRERVRVIGAEHAHLVGQQRLEQSQRLARVAALAGPESDVVAGRERVRVIGAETAFNTRPPQAPAPQVVARRSGGSRRESLQRPVRLAQGPQVLCFALERVALDRVVQVHRPRASRGQDLDAIRECPVRGQRLLRSTGDDVLDQGLVKQPRMLSFSAGSQFAPRGPLNRNSSSRRPACVANPPSFSLAAQSSVSGNTGPAPPAAMTDSTRRVSSLAPHRDEQFLVGVPEREFSCLDLGVGVFAQEVREHPHHEPVALCRLDDLLLPRRRDGAPLKIPGHLLRWGRSKNVGVEAASGSSVSGRAVTIRRRNGNPASSFRASITASRAPVARRSSASITKRTSAFGRQALERPDHLPFQAPQPLLFGIRRLLRERLLRLSEPRHRSRQLLGKDARELLRRRRLREKRDRLHEPGGNGPSRNVGPRQRRRERRLAPTGLAHHRHATLSLRARHHLSEVRRYLIRQCKSLDLVGQSGCAPKAHRCGRRSSPTTAPHPGCRSDAAAPGSGKTSLAESADQRSASARRAPLRSHRAAISPVFG